jgi:dephospho-CoA kinase
MTFVLGLTGSIGMGKSTTAQIFRDKGIPVWDADATVHKLYAKDGAAVDPVQNLNPDAVMDGQISRDQLKVWISEDETALTQIEAVVHPLVRADREAFLAGTESDIVVLDIPLLFETNAQDQVDAVVCVTVPSDIQKKRVLDRPGMTEDQFELILGKQVPDAEKQARSDYVIETQTLEQARSAVDTVLADVRKRLQDA